MAGLKDATETSPLLGDRSVPVNDAESNATAVAAAAEDQSGNDAEEEQDVSAEEPSTTSLVLILGSAWLATFFAAVDSTIIATLVVPISSSFKSFTLVSWLATAYLIANAALQPLSGRLTDIYGRRTGLILANIFFAAGTLLCGLGKTESAVIAGRVIAGMGGGCLNTISTFVASDLVPLRKRGVVQGLGNIVWGAGAGVGGVFGGWVSDVWGWRVAFLCQVPFLVISGIIIFFTVKIPVQESKESRLKRIDFLGAASLVLTLVLLLLGLNSGGNVVPWSDPLVYVSLILSGVFLIVFVYVEARVALEPVIPVRLLLIRTVGAAGLANWFASMGYLSFLYYGPIYFQVLGLSATAAGARMIPAPVGIAIGSLGSGMIMRATGRYYILGLLSVTSLTVSGILMLTLLDINTPHAVGFIIFFLAGLGYGSMLTIALLAMIGAVDHKHQAVITSASYAFRSTGSSIGITVSSVIMQNLVRKQLWERFGDRKNAAEIIERVRNNIDEIRHVPESWKEGVLEAYVGALKGVWGVIFGFFALTAVVTLFFREYKLYDNLARK